MKVLVAWGSTRGGTEGIARMIGEGLRDEGHEVELHPAEAVRRLDGYDAAIVGGALYANRWHHGARRFVSRHEAALRRIPVWMFSSGPLDDSAARTELPPVPQVAVLSSRIGARSHTTFGGRLAPDATGLIASSMAKKSSGDWRDTKLIRAWTTAIAAELPTARPNVVTASPAHSVPRLVGHAVVGALICAAMVALSLGGVHLPLVVHALLAPVVFGLVANHYFAARGAREPWPSAIVFAAAFLVFELGIRTGMLRSFEIPRGVGDFWVPLVLVLVVTWIVGSVKAILPFPKPAHP